MILTNYMFVKKNIQWLSIQMMALFYSGRGYCRSSFRILPVFYYHNDYMQVEKWCYSIPGTKKMNWISMDGKGYSLNNVSVDRLLRTAVFQDNIRRHIWHQSAGTPVFRRKKIATYPHFPLLRSIYEKATHRETELRGMVNGFRIKKINFSSDRS